MASRHGSSEFRMDKKVVFFIILSCLVVLITSGCELPSGATPPPTSEVIHTVVAQTLIAQFTLSAQPPTETLEPVTPSDTPTPTQSAQPTETPTLTSTSTNTPVPVPPTPTVPLITATINTNCRFGPSKYYQVVGYLLVGQWVQVYGRSADGYWWYIQNPSQFNTSCWVWNQTTVVTGNVSNLPVIAPPPPPPPTPTPVPIQPQPPGFSAAFDNIHDCAGQPDAVFKITNTGGSTLESMNLTLYDLTASTTLSIVNSDIPFMGAPNECPVGGENIPPGAVRYVAGMLGSPAPSGHQVRATIKICTSDNLKGACSVVTVDFTVP
jgi:uncharacterized protein YgiM (DUF1202 family)